MSLALKALVLVRVDARHGQWVDVRELAGHLGVSLERVQQACTELVAAGLLHYATRGAAHVYGVGVEGVAP